ncbi:ABC transporter ATP-binding protein [Candidatus Thorarchaeota archaeon]|nr:ABC transporter ATP-binding protein [Candidatus Thorarchaeota archaeon]TFG97227.1 MAG: ABC transporter ATP-binding protein [Candidatus Thorarchaeota archaeon]
MVRIDLVGLVREFADGTKIGPINLNIRDGELLTLLGPSGSGKTTTLRMIAGFIEAEEGSLLFDDHDMVSVPPRERNIGMVFQSVALFPNMTVYQNIAFGPEMAEWPHEKTVERVEELADLLGIRSLLMRKISEISGGEAQRVGLARALAKEPSLLLLDEPLSALDPQLRERLQTEIRIIQKKVKVTTIYVTHSQDEAFAISDRVAIINDGIVEQVGTPEELYDRPANEFIARFLGSGNVLQGTVRQVTAGELCVDVMGIQLPVRGDCCVGDVVKFSIKPEDIEVSLGTDKSVAMGFVTSILPQVGSFKITIDFQGTPIIALTYDEELVTKLRLNGDRQVSFTFKPKLAVILGD